MVVLLHVVLRVLLVLVVLRVLVVLVLHGGCGEAVGVRRQERHLHLHLKVHAVVLRGQRGLVLEPQVVGVGVGVGLGGVHLVVQVVGV